MSAASVTTVGGSGFGPTMDRKKNAISSSVLGVLIFIAAELMFFAALISAHSIISTGSVEWPPLDQPRLPIEATAINSLFLLVSGATIFFACRSFKAEAFSGKSRTLLLLSILLGGIFVGLQGSEWAQLISHGFTLQSNVYSSFFYLIIGTHAVHAIGALFALLRVFIKFQNRSLDTESFTAHSIFWYFVVGVWPVLYVLVYL